MITALLAIGFLAGISTCLLALKLLPVKIQFAWNKDKGIVQAAKKKVETLHPNYCNVCKATPCQDSWNHKYD